MGSAVFASVDRQAVAQLRDRGVPAADPAELAS